MRSDWWVGVTQVKTERSKGILGKSREYTESWGREHMPCWNEYKMVNMRGMTESWGREHMPCWNEYKMVNMRGMTLYTCMLSHFSHVWLFSTPWTVALQAPLPMGFSRQEYWSGLLDPSPGDLPNPGTEPVSLMSLALAGGLFFFFFNH